MILTNIGLFYPSSSPFTVWHTRLSACPQTKLIQCLVRCLYNLTHCGYTHWTIIIKRLRRQSTPIKWSWCNLKIPEWLSAHYSTWGLQRATELQKWHPVLKRSGFLKLWMCLPKIQKIQDVRDPCGSWNDMKSYCINQPTEHECKYNNDAQESTLLYTQPHLL